jgi:hypothetical protein
MAIEGDIDGLHLGADHTVDLTVYTTQAKTVIQDITGWTIVLDMRPSDQSTTAKLSVTGTISGVFNSVPATNTQKVSFAIPRAIITPAIFPGADPSVQCSVWRTDTGSRQPLRHGSAKLTRTTQSA